MKILLAADHGGYELKEKLKKVLIELDYEIEDFGPNEYISQDDYPDYIVPAMKELQRNTANKAIVICRNGVGVSVLANKFNDVRAGLCFSKEHATKARIDDNINVLALPSDYITFDQATETMAAFLNTPFSNEQRHIRRLEKITDVEK